MIRFIISDVDGTLLQKGSFQISEQLKSQIPELKEKGILFAVASGRNYNELKGILDNVGKDVLYITCNGAVVIFDDEIVCKDIIERRLALDVIRDVLAMDECQILVTGERESYILQKDIVLAAYLKNELNYHSQEIEDFYKIKEDIVKISVRQPGGVVQEKLDYFYHKYGSKLQITTSGPEWIDVTSLFVTKGNAIAMVQHLYGISPEDTMTFGDNFNDIDMFEHSYYSYAMQHAHPDIKKAAKHIAENVETIIEDVIRM